MQLRPELAIGVREHECVDWEGAILFVGLELEAFLEQLTEHQLAAARLALLLGAEGIANAVAAFGLGDNVEMIGRHPVGPAGDLEVLQLIGVPNQHLQRDVGGGEPSAGLDADHHASVV